MLYVNRTGKQLLQLLRAETKNIKHATKTLSKVLVLLSAMTTEQSKDVSYFDVILPMFRPAKNWDTEVYQKFSQISDSLPLPVRLILVNDGTGKELIQQGVERLTERITHFTFIDSQPNRGKGYALRKGVAASEAPYIILTDIDFPFTQKSILDIGEALTDQGADLAVGQRDDSYYQNIPTSRRRLSRALATLNKYLFKLPVRDTQCGLKGLSAEGRRLFLQTTIDRYLFDLELILLARRKPHIHIIPVPVTLNAGVQLSRMRANVILPEMWNLIKIMTKQWM